MLTSADNNFLIVFPMKEMGQSEPSKQAREGEKGSDDIVKE